MNISWVVEFMWMRCGDEIGLDCKENNGKVGEYNELWKCKVENLDCV